MMGKPTTAAIARYRKNHYDRIELQVPKGAKEKLYQAAREAGAETFSAWAVALMERETGLDLALTGTLPTIQTAKK